MYVILHLAVSVEHRLVTEGWTDRHTDKRRQLIPALASIARVKMKADGFVRGDVQESQDTISGMMGKS